MKAKFTFYTRSGLVIEQVVIYQGDNDEEVIEEHESFVQDLREAMEERKRPVAYVSDLIIELKEVFAFKAEWEE
jgi:hypothetical protein